MKLSRLIGPFSLHGSPSRQRGVQHFWRESVHLLLGHLLEFGHGRNPGGGTPYSQARSRGQVAPVDALLGPLPRSVSLKVGREFLHGLCRCALGGFWVSALAALLSHVTAHAVGEGHHLT